MKRQAKTETELLDHATNNLLRALKQDMRKKDGCVDYDKLRKHERIPSM
jgi:quinol monooxygenase YgiN